MILFSSSFCSPVINTGKPFTAITHNWTVRSPHESPLSTWKPTLWELNCSHSLTPHYYYFAHRDTLLTPHIWQKKNLSHHFLLLACVFLWMWDVAQSSSEITCCFTIAQCPTGGNHLDRMLGAVSVNITPWKSRTLAFLRFYCLFVFFNVPYFHRLNTFLFCLTNK